MGKKKTRNVIETYRGFDIIEIKTIDRDWYGSTTKREYAITKEGNIAKPSQWLENKVAKLTYGKNLIDDMLDNGTLYFTNAEVKKYVGNPLRNGGYYMSYNDFMKLMKEHMKGDERVKALIERRLSSDNFRAECSYLREREYAMFEDYIATNYRCGREFILRVSTMRTPIKDIEGFKEGLKDAIQGYLNSDSCDKLYEPIVASIEVGDEFCG